MSKLLSAAEYEDGIVEGGRPPSRLLAFLPYLLILTLNFLVGVGYTSISRRPLVLYWEVLAVITGVLCIVSGWFMLTRETAA